jgi:hypothetical protein
MIQILHNIQNVEEGEKTSEKSDITDSCFQIYAVTNLSAPSCFWNNIGRNSLLPEIDRK